jgi:hypothetical protein
MESYREKNSGVTDCTGKSVSLDREVSWRYPVRYMMTMFS